MLLAGLVLLAHGGEPSTELALPENDRPEDIARLPSGPVDYAPLVGAVTNDRYLNQYVVGGTVTVHANDVLGIELLGWGSPDLGRATYKPATRHGLESNQVIPHKIVRTTATFAFGLKFTPLYGTLHGRKRTCAVDLSAVVGTGLVETHDDLAALDRTDDPDALATANQIHPALVVGAIGRVRVRPTVAVFAELRQVSFVEVVESDTLWVESLALASAGLSFSPGAQ